MIKTEKEYLEAKKRLDKEFKVIEGHQRRMEKLGMNEEQVHLAIDPLTSFALQLKEEVEEYEKLKRCDLDSLSES